MLESLHPNHIALIAAFFTASSQTLIGKAIGRLSPAVASLVANAMIALIAALLYFVGEGVEAWPASAVFWFALSGVVANFAARYLMYSAIGLIGLSRTQILFQFSPLWSSLVAIAVLGERPTLTIGLGTLCIVGGAILIVSDRKGDVKKTRLAFYLLPVLAALVMAAAPTMRKHAFEILPSATFGLTVACLVAFSLQAALLPITERKVGIRLELRPLVIAVAGGVMNAAAAMLFWTSLRLGEVIQVVPIRRLSVLLVVFFSWLFLGKQDRITWRVVAGAVITLIGGAAIMWEG